MTTLIISLGVVARPSYLVVIEIAVALLTLQVIAINRAAGIAYPLWASKVKPSPAAPPGSTSLDRGGGEPPVEADDADHERGST